MTDQLHWPIQRLSGDEHLAGPQFAYLGAHDVGINNPPTLLRGPHHRLKVIPAQVSSVLG